MLVPDITPAKICRTTAMARSGYSLEASCAPES
jgi:hypothetical protein